MRKSLIQFLLVAMLSLFTSAAWAQTTVHGQLVDAETGEPLVGAAVMVEGTTQGSVTDIDGYFKQSVAYVALQVHRLQGPEEKNHTEGRFCRTGNYQDAARCSDVVGRYHHFIRCGGS